jgi:hypothetical protein
MLDLYLFSFNNGVLFDEEALSMIDRLIGDFPGNI